MKCETVSMSISDLALRVLDINEREPLMNHIETCTECRDALRGAEALLEVRRQQIEEPPAQLFERVMATVASESSQPGSKQRFWIGAGFGGAIAASLFALALFFGWTDGLRPDAPNTEEFVVSVDEARVMNLAFETDRKLDGAQITILLSGNIEIDGYGSQRELSWSENLDSGVNRLSLPVLASDVGGGQMVVRMTHPLSEQVFVINLPTES